VQQQHKLNSNKTLQSTVTGYQNSKCSSELVAQICKRNSKRTITEHRMSRDRQDGKTDMYA